MSQIINHLIISNYNNLNNKKISLYLVMSLCHHLYYHFHHYFVTTIDISILILIFLSFVFYMEK